MIVFAGTTGMLDDLPINQCKAFEEEMYRFMDNAHPAIRQGILEKKTLDDDLKKALSEALQEFKQRFTADKQAAAGSLAHA